MKQAACINVHWEFLGCAAVNDTAQWPPWTRNYGNNEYQKQFMQTPRKLQTSWTLWTPEHYRKDALPGMWLWLSAVSWVCSVARTESDSALLPTAQNLTLYCCSQPRVWLCIVALSARIWLHVLAHGANLTVCTVAHSAESDSELLLTARSLTLQCWPEP
jgi:hypothetical protein